MSRRLLARLALANERRWIQTVPDRAKYLLRDRMNRRYLQAEWDQKRGRRIWWPRAAGVCCTAKHGFSRAPIAQVEGPLFNRRIGRREPFVRFRRCWLDYDLPF